MVTLFTIFIAFVSMAVLAILLVPIQGWGPGLVGAYLGANVIAALAVTFIALKA